MSYYNSQITEAFDLTIIIANIKRIIYLYFQLRIGNQYTLPHRD